MNRKAIFIACVALFLILSRLQAQNISDEIATAFQQANFETLSRYANSHVELLLEGQHPQTGREATIDRLKRFFANCTVKGFNIKHQGQRQESSFLVGMLSTSQGTFRVNCYLKKENEQYVIHQIRIEKTND